MVPEPDRSSSIGRWLDDDEVEPERQVRQSPSVRQTAGDQRQRGAPKVTLLAPIQRLLRKAVPPVGPPPNLDDDERCRRPWIDGDDVQLVPAHPEVPPQERPVHPGKAAGDQLLCSISKRLTIRSHVTSLIRSAHRRHHS